MVLVALALMTVLQAVLVTVGEDTGIIEVGDVRFTWASA